MSRGRPSAPVPLEQSHDLAGFSCGEASLDEWLNRRARGNQAGGATRTYVVTAAGSATVIGYYALAAAGIAADSVLPGRFRRNMTAVIPIAVVARLAVDRRWQGRGLARAMLRDAILRIDQAASQIGIRGVLVDALSEDAKAFYEAMGFTALAEPPLTLVATLADLRGAMTDEVT